MYGREEIICKCGECGKKIHHEEEFYEFHFQGFGTVDLCPLCVEKYKTVWRSDGEDYFIAI